MALLILALARTPFFGEPGKQHSDGGHVLFDCGRRDPALQCFDICGNRNGLNVFEVLIPGALIPGQELLDRHVIRGSRVSVADWDRKSTISQLPAGERPP